MRRSKPRALPLGDTPINQMNSNENPAVIQEGRIVL